MAQVVGGTIGAVVGFAIGGPAGAQWGWAIGSAVGSSFTTIKQPRIGDLAEIRAGEGGPRARVYGTFRPIGGQVVWSGRPREIRTRKRQGKGGPKVESSTILRSYAIGICEGPITSVSRIWRNNELVYDVRPGSTILAESTRWLQGKTILLGGWDQLPHPTIEAEAGAANAPAMRGTAMLVVTDEDLTDLRGAIPGYQFEVHRGNRRSLTTPIYPVQVVEDLDTSAGTTSIRLQVSPIITEALQTSAGISAGVLTSAFVVYQIPPEGLENAAGIIGGSRSTPLQNHQVSPEAVDSTAALIAGNRRLALIAYNNWPSEALDVTGSITGGTRT